MGSNRQKGRLCVLSPHIFSMFIRFMWWFLQVGLSASRPYSIRATGLNYQQYLSASLTTHNHALLGFNQESEKY